MVCLLSCPVLSCPPRVPPLTARSDPSIKAIILKIDEDFHHAFIVEDLDDQTLVVKESKLAELKERLEKILEKTQMMEKEDESDPEQPG